jgi:hypothetical protein
MEQTAARPKNGRPLQNPLLTRQEGFVEAVPARAFRDGTGPFTVNLSHCVKISFLSPDDTNVLKMVIDLNRKRKFEMALIVREFRHS